MTKTPHQLHNRRQKLLAGFDHGTLLKIYQALREIKARIGRKLQHYEFEKVIHDIKYDK